MCFFFNQKTAYDLRISDWSSDVCSSDLDAASLAPGAATAVIVTTLPGVVTNRHRVEVTPLFPTSGLDCVAWVSGSNNVAWFVRNPSGNPYGTIARKSVVQGKSLSVRVDLGGRRIIKKNKHTQPTQPCSCALINS